MDDSIHNQYDWVKSIINNYDNLYHEHIELKKKYVMAQNEIENLIAQNEI